MKRMVSLTVIGCAVVLASCGGDNSGADTETTTAYSSSATETTTQTKATKSGSGSTVAVRKTRYGRILVDGKGLALYIFGADKGKRSTCYEDCATAWPPFLTKGPPKAGKGSDDGLIGTTTRKDGKTQITYRGRPLYYYVDDKKPGQVLCHNVTEFGGLWLVVQPNGKAVPG